LRFRLWKGADLADCRACGKDVIYKQHILTFKTLGPLETKRSTQVTLPGPDIQSDLGCCIPEAAKPFEELKANSTSQGLAKKEGLVEASFQLTLSMQ